MQKKLPTIIALILLLALGWYGKKWYQAEGGVVKKAQPPVALQIITASEKPVFENYQTVAEFKAKRTVTVRNGVAGQVNRLIAEPGQFVKSQDLLARLQPSFELRAPIEGYLTDWLVSDGEYIEANSELAKIVNTEILSVEYYVPEHYMHLLKRGQRVELKLAAYGEDLFVGQVHYISPVVDQLKHSIRVRADIDNKAGQLMPGAFTRITHILREVPNALTIPDACLIQKISGYEVYRIKAGKAEMVPVKLGIRSAGRVQIIEGLEAGDEIALGIPPHLHPGAKVVTENWQGSW